MELELSIIDYTSPFYEAVLALRNDILRKPLGLNLYEEDLTEDRDQYIVIAVMEQKVQACLMLKILDHITVKIRQMAVATTMQQKGVGVMLMTYAENFCALNNYTIAELHARKTAIGFYQKLGYQSDFVEFEEVGIPHVKMTKKLS